MLPLLPLTLLWLRSSRPLLSSRLIWQSSRHDRQLFSSRCLRECFPCFRLFRTDRTLCSSSFWQTGLRAPGLHDSHSSAYRCLDPSCSVCTPFSSSVRCCTSNSGRTPTTFIRSFFLSDPTSHPGLIVVGYQLRQCSAANATSSCYYYCCCGGVYDLFSSCSTASVRVSTSSSFYDRSWIRD
jgi:hypothetical protein